MVVDPTQVEHDASQLEQEVPELRVPVGQLLSQLFWYKNREPEHDVHVLTVDVQVAHGEVQAVQILLTGICPVGQLSDQLPPLLKYGVDVVVKQLVQILALVHVEQGETQVMQVVESKYVPLGQVA